MSKEKLLPPVPHGWDDGSNTMGYYLKVATRNTKKDIGYLYMCTSILEKALLEEKPSSMSAEVMDQLADMQKQIDVLSNVVKRLLPKPSVKKVTKKPAAKKSK